MNSPSTRGFRPRAAISWSGGKDCCTALDRVKNDFEVVALVTMFNEDGTRSRSHGLRPEVLRAQAERLGMTVFEGHCTWDSYTDEFCRALAHTAEHGVTHIIFGDIMFDAHKAWTERVCARHGLVSVQPIWGLSTDDLAREFIRRGGQAQLVTVRPPLLDETWLGRTLTLDLLDELTARGIDACGENGEYHSLVTNTPLFSSPLSVTLGQSVLQGGCWAVDVMLATSSSSPACTTT